MIKNKGQKTDESRTSNRAKEREQDAQINKMMRYPPSLNGINKNLP